MVGIADHDGVFGDDDDGCGSEAGGAPVGA